MNLSIPPSFLNKSEFIAALTKGLGRAALHIQTYGINDYYDLVLDACLHDQNFDPQCNPNRAPWLLSMIRESPFYAEIRQAILHSLDDSEYHDLIQTCAFLVEMSRTGDGEARQKLKEYVYNMAAKGSPYDGTIYDLFLKIQTDEEFLELAGIFGRRLKTKRSAHLPESPLFAKNKGKWMEILSRHGKNDPYVQLYWNYLVREEVSTQRIRAANSRPGKKERRRLFRQEYPISRLLVDVQNKKCDRRFSIFGSYATPRELLIVFQILSSEKDPLVRKQLLSVFEENSLPEVNETIFQWAADPDEGMREATIQALAATKNEKVHIFARDLLTRTMLVSSFYSVLNLFQRNYTEEDAGLITTALASFNGNEYDLHTIGLDLLKLSEIHSDPNLADALLWVYEATSCSTCRSSVLVELNKYNRIDERLAREILYDVHPDIRKLARKLSIVQQ